MPLHKEVYNDKVKQVNKNRISAILAILTANPDRYFTDYDIAVKLDEVAKTASVAACFRKMRADLSLEGNIFMTRRCMNKERGAWEYRMLPKDKFF